MNDYQNPKEGKTYISPALPAFGGKDHKVRIASKVLPSTDGYEYAKERGEVVLRHKPDAATYISAKFIEDTRGIFVLTVQKFMVETGTPYGAGFCFVNTEIDKFCEFLEHIRSIQFKNNKKVNISDEDLRKLVLTSTQARSLVSDNEELFAEVLSNSITIKDVVAIAYRKKQLGFFEKLLHDAEYFEQLKQRKNCKDEALWQMFFEKNSWIFGYGLSYIYSSGLDDRKLEQVVRGYNILQSGKRVDALLKTKALASTLCFVEIKTHKTQLLCAKPYRSGCWAPSDELSGAVAQIQGTVSYAAEKLYGKLDITDSNGFPTTENVFNFQPKSFVIIGNLSQFIGENGVNQEHLRSFELFRRNIYQPEIITFDELYERARHIVETDEA
ncbi:Shedu immune nuclease family protein [Pseudomonas aeruginosa]|uniref:Shedu immune nuclease family protein n=1 Tax=Pseudomonas aeruginosa TaxID=287 RepID=UPI0012467284|nr:Shedu immune nuclease family protein [Pseudomonas aeruginosa]KAB0772293.1 DUF4263 domain-containing protein [Pseudomonas aeruginosa]